MAFFWKKKKNDPEEEIKPKKKKESELDVPEVQNVAVSKDEVERQRELKGVVNDEKALEIIETASSQNMGKMPDQQDAFGFAGNPDPASVAKKGFLAVVSDGMSKMDRGKEISQFVVNKTSSYFDRFTPGDDVEGQLSETMRKVNNDVVEMFVNDGKVTSGATATYAYIYKHKLYWSTVGDNHIYCMRGNRLMRLNEDHDYRNQLYRMYIDGDLELWEVQRSAAAADRLTSFIGNSAMEIDSGELRLRDNDIILVCTDGVYNGIGKVSLMAILKAYDSQGAADKIIEEVLNADVEEQGNMTAVIMSYKLKR